MAKPEMKKVTILKITVAEKRTVFPGEVLQLEAHEAAILISGEKAKEWEAGDEAKFKKESSKKAS